MSFTIISKPTAINKVYRYFHEETHADAFMKGQVRVSTLNICRRYENPMQGDKDEACLLYYSQSTMGRGNDPKMQEVAKRLNMDIKLGANSWVAMIGTSSRSEQEDAFIYCTSTQFDPSKFKSDFGEYCVQIIDTGYFLKKISEAIHCINPLINSCAGKVNYKDRLYSDLNDPPSGDLAFIKPTQYKEQSEYRFLWQPIQSSSIDFLDIEAPRIIPLLTRLT